MPSKSEIDFCERWLDLRGADGFVVWLHHPDLHRRQPDPFPSPGISDGFVSMKPGAREHTSVYSLGRRKGADLVASYDAAKSLGLEILPDDVAVAYEPPRDWPKPTEPCPDCEFGRVSIPGLLSIVPVDPDHEVVQTMTCPTCKGEKVVEVEPIRDIGRPLEGLGESIDVAKRAVLSATGAAASFSQAVDGWQPLTPEFAATLEGKRIEAKVGGETPVDPDRHDQYITARGISPCAKWLRVDFTVEGRTRAGVLAIHVGDGYPPLEAGWSVRVVDPADLGVINGGWRQLTRVEGQRLAGKPFEARRDVADPPRRHVASSAQPDAFAGFLRLVGGGNMRFDGTWWVRDAVADQG